MERCRGPFRGMLWDRCNGCATGTTRWFCGLAFTWSCGPCSRTAATSSCSSSRQIACLCCISSSPREPDELIEAGLIPPKSDGVCGRFPFFPLEVHHQQTRNEPVKKYRVELTPAQHEELSRMISAGKAAA